MRQLLFLINTPSVKFRKEPTLTLIGPSSVLDRTSSRYWEAGESLFQQAIASTTVLLVNKPTPNFLYKLFAVWWSILCSSLSIDSWHQFCLIRKWKTNIYFLKIISFSIISSLTWTTYSMLTWLQFTWVVQEFILGLDTSSFMREDW